MATKRETTPTGAPTWRPLSDNVRTLRPLLARALEAKGGDRTAAVGALGPELLHYARLALAFGPQLVVHELRPEATLAVDEADLDAAPREPPRLLRGPFLLEVARPERGERLFGETCSLGGYQLDGATYLFGLDYPDGAYAAIGRTQWGTGDEVLAEWSWMQSVTTTAAEGWAQQAMRFALLLGLLLDTEKSPLRQLDEGRRPSERGPAARGKPRPGQGWTVRHVSLRAPLPTSRPADEAAPADEAGTTGGRDPSAIEVPVKVRCHKRRQRFGPGRSFTREIEIEPFESRRWIKPWPRKVVVRA